MGGFYNSVHIRTTNVALVQQLLENLAANEGAKFLVAPAINGWVSVFPSDAGMELGLGATLAESIHDPMIHCAVHDDDIFTYEFYLGGEQLDAYNSCPDYFGETTAGRGGSLKRFDAILPESQKRESLRMLLDKKRFTFEYERLEKFADLIGLPNAVTSYEYLQSGEREGIQQWKNFVHVPDLSAAKAAAKAAKAREKAEWKRLLKEGPLVLDRAGSKVGGGRFFEYPAWCIDTSRNEVLLAWSGNPVGDAKPTRVERVNPATGISTPTQLLITDKVRCMAASPDGKYLATGSASGIWKVEIWSIETGASLATIDQKRMVEQVCFGADCKTLLALSENVISKISLDALERVERIELPDHAQRMAIHPSGTHLAVASAGLLSIVELESRKIVGTIWIPEPPGPRRDVLEQYVAQVAARNLERVTRDDSASEREPLKARTNRLLVPKQSVQALNFSKSGALIFCGTSAGVAVLEWAKVLTTPDSQSIQPAAFIRAESFEGAANGTNVCSIH